jgi:hypothetical protein
MLADCEQTKTHRPGGFWTHAPTAINRSRSHQPFGGLGGLLPNNFYYHRPRLQASACLLCRHNADLVGLVPTYGGI